ncbi:MAG: hypothetical protein KIT24_11075 [Phycisphaeraceae bacterium]|nr:hypothetical protein [Phycisphaeraceae bacterium]
MNLTQFLEHWKIAENPFRAEEARNDDVFARLCAASAEAVAGSRPSALPGLVHSDFEKILGQLTRPSSAVVFGEKGSGKTAIRLQIEAAVDAHNRTHPNARVLLVPYDDLNSKLDALVEASGTTPLEAFRTIRLVDHLDAILSIAVTRLIDAVLRRSGSEGPDVLGPEPARAVKRMELSLKRDLLLLQTVYDADERADERTRRLTRLIRLPRAASRRVLNVLVYGGWLVPAGVLTAYLTIGEKLADNIWAAAFAAAVAGWGGCLFKRFGWDRMRLARIARRVTRQTRLVDRDEASLVRSLARLDPHDRRASIVPMTDSDETRYAMLSRLRRVLQVHGYTGLVVVVDRVDEPTLISGDPEKMRAVIWPMFNNKFMQQEGIGIKMLLPLDLRYALFKESSAFFQEARLDKQGLVERLVWTGPMLYDLCSARLNACRPEGAERLSLLDLFADDVTRQDLVDALDQMHQPRDAFKLIYRCLTEHCANVSVEQGAFRVPRSVLDHVRRQEVERLQQLYRGIRPG